MERVTTSKLLGLCQLVLQSALLYVLHLHNALVAPSPFSEESTKTLFRGLRYIYGELQEYKTKFRSCSTEDVFTRTH